MEDSNVHVFFYLEGEDDAFLSFGVNAPPIIKHGEKLLLSQKVTAPDSEEKEFSDYFIVQDISQSFEYRIGPRRCVAHNHIAVVVKKVE